MAEPAVDSLYNSSFDQALLDVDFELTFDDLYFPSENESFSIPVVATNLEMSGDCSATAAADCVVDVSEATIASSSESGKVVVDQKLKVEEEEAATRYKTKRKRDIREDTWMNSKYRRSDEDGEVEEKRKARLVRNRESALLSRQRKKHYVEELEDKVKNLQSVITDLNSKVSYFMSENATLRQKVGPGKGMCWLPPSGMYPWMPFPSYMVKPQGFHQVMPLLPIPRLKPQGSLATKVKKKSEAKTKKVASVSVLGLLFCLFLFCALAPSGVFYDEFRGRVLNSTSSSSSRAQCGRGSQRDVSATANSVPLGIGSELLIASLFVPRNEQLVKLHGNLTIHSVLAREKDMASETKPSLPLSDYTRTNDMSKHLNTEKRKALSSSGSDGSKDKLNSTTPNGEIQRWFREGLAGPMFSSGMCTQVFQFDVSTIPTSPATQHPNRKNNRRILRGGLPLSDLNLTKDQNSSNKENFSETKPSSSTVVSILVDPREEGSDGDVDGVTKGIKPLSTIFIVVLVDGVKYVTYSCLLPPPEEVPLLVTT